MAVWTRILGLDRLAEKQTIDVDQLAGARLLLRHTLREAVCGGYAALHLFYHEEDDCVRGCLWQPGAEPGCGAWVETVPLGGVCGRDLLREVRAIAGRWRPRGGPVHGELRVVLDGQRRAVAVYSPHAWDVRLYLSHERPSKLPYSLVLRASER